MDLDGDYGIALYELCLSRQFPKMLCFGPITREYLKKDTDGDYVVLPDETELDALFSMIFKDSYSSYSL